MKINNWVRLTSIYLLIMFIIIISSYPAFAVIAGWEEIPTEYMELVTETANKITTEIDTKNDQTDEFIYDEMQTEAVQASTTESILENNSTGGQLFIPYYNSLYGKQATINDHEAMDNFETENITNDRQIFNAPKLNTDISTTNEIAIENEPVDEPIYGEPSEVLDKLPGEYEIKPFTPPGVATVIDNAISANGKEFFTITTEAKNVFYLIIDRQRNTENVYFLNAVTEADLLALIDKNDGKLKNNDVSKSTQVTKTEPTVENIPAAITQVEPTEKSNNKIYFLCVIVVLGIGGVAYYFVRVKGKKNSKDADDIDDDLNDDSDGSDDVDSSDDDDFKDEYRYNVNPDNIDILNDGMEINDNDK